MRYARLRTRSPEPTSPMDAAFRSCEDLRHVSLRYGGIGMSPVPTYVYEVVGDLDEVEAALSTWEGVSDVEVTPLAGGGRTDEAYLSVTGEVTDLELSVKRTFNRDSLVTMPPIVFEDEEAYFHVLGRDEDLRAAIADAREQLPVDVERIGEDDRPSERETASLTPRQREAMLRGSGSGTTTYHAVGRTRTSPRCSAVPPPRRASTSGRARLRWSGNCWGERGLVSLWYQFGIVLVL